MEYYFVPLFPTHSAGMTDLIHQHWPFKSQKSGALKSGDTKNIKKDGFILWPLGDKHERASTYTCDSLYLLLAPVTTEAKLLSYQDDFV